MVSAFLVFGGVALATRFLPRSFYAKAVVEVKPSAFRENVSSVRKIMSKATLIPVIQRLGLAKSWGAEGKLSDGDAYLKLLPKLELRKIRNTDLVEVGIWDPNPQAAADIANAIAAEFQNQEQQKNLQAQFAKLEEEVADWAKKTEQAAQEVQTIRAKAAIHDSNPEVSEGDAGQQFSPEYIAAKNRYLQIKAIFQTAAARVATEKLQSSAKISPVSIWEKAEPPANPSKPNVPAIIAIAGIVIVPLMILPGAILLIIGLVLSPPRPPVGGL